MITLLVQSPKAEGFYASMEVHRNSDRRHLNEFNARPMKFGGWNLCGDLQEMESQARWPAGLECKAAEGTVLIKRLAQEGLCRLIVRESGDEGCNCTWM